jgi:hypothetical protein
MYEQLGARGGRGKREGAGRQSRRRRRRRRRVRALAASACRRRLPPRQPECPPMDRAPSHQAPAGEEALATINTRARLWLHRRRLRPPRRPHRRRSVPPPALSCRHRSLVRPAPRPAPDSTTSSPPRSDDPLLHGSSQTRVERIHPREKSCDCRPPPPPSTLAPCRRRRLSGFPSMTPVSRRAAAAALLLSPGAPPPACPPQNNNNKRTANTIPRSRTSIEITLAL